MVDAPPPPHADRPPPQPDVKPTADNTGKSPDAPKETAPKPDAPHTEPSTLAKIGAVASTMFGAATGQTPGGFAQGMWDKLKSVTYEPVKTIYAPGGMADQAAQKFVDRVQGIQKPDETYVSKEEHAKQLGAIAGIAATLFPGFGEIAAAGSHMVAVTPEGAAVAVHAGAAEVTVPAVVEGAAKATANAAFDTMAKGDNTGKVEPGEKVQDLTGGHNMSPEQAKYQEQVTNLPADKTYHVKGVSFDGFEPGAKGAQDTLVEAKHLGDDGRFARAYESMNQQQFKDFAHLLDRAEKLTDQARAQVKAAEGTGARIEWRCSGEKATEALKVLFKNDPNLKGKITVEYVPFKPKR
jgi:hypothetical protein